MGFAVLLEKIIVSSWRLCFGVCVQGSLVETCRQNSASGTLNFAVSVDGPQQVFLRDFLKL